MSSSARAPKPEERCLSGDAPYASSGGKFLRLLLVEDSEDDALILMRHIRKSGFDVQHVRVQGELALRKALQDPGWDLVISDFNMPGMTGLRVLEIVRGIYPDLPFILISGSIGEQLAVQAMKAGAQDYLMKDSLTRLGEAIARELREAEGRGKRREAEGLLELKSKQLVVAQRMEAIGQLAGGIAHDLNNIMGACSLYAEIALDPARSVEEIRESVREIVKTQERGTRIVRQLLAFGRRQPTDPRVIDLNQVIEDTRKMVGRLAGADIEFVLKLDPRPATLVGDPSQLDQVILNLVVNARDAMPKGGRVTIESGHEEVGPDHFLLRSGAELPAGAYVRLSVEDTGTGMDEQTKAKLFEPFFTTKGLGRGTGLGLATVYGIVKQAGGEIRVWSELGRGSRFDLYFRATEKGLLSEVAAASTSMSAPAVLPGAILLVEDDPGMRGALKDALERAGYRLWVAEDGEQGQRLFQEHAEDIALLISDVVMPKQSGPEMLRALRAQRPELRALFLTGYGRDVLDAHELDRRGVAVLSKPFQIAQLTQRIREVLEQPEDLEEGSGGAK